MSEGALFRVVQHCAIGSCLVGCDTLLEARAIQLTDPIFKLRGSDEFSFIESAGEKVQGTVKTNSAVLP